MEEADTAMRDSVSPARPFLLLYRFCSSGGGGGVGEVTATRTQKAPRSSKGIFARGREADIIEKEKPVSILEDQCGGMKSIKTESWDS